MNISKYFSAMLVLYSCIIASFLCSCGSSKSLVDDDNRAIENKKSPFMIEINVYQTSAYCGGARPSEAITVETQKAKPFPNQMIYVKKGSKNMLSEAIIDSANTNTKGIARFKLLPGTYNLVRKERADSSYYKSIIYKHSKESKDYSAIDTLCLNSWISEPDLTFTVTDQTMIQFDLLIHHECWWNSLPCVRYKGPVPN